MTSSKVKPLFSAAFLKMLTNAFVPNLFGSNTLLEQAAFLPIVLMTFAATGFASFSSLAVVTAGGFVFEPSEIRF